MRNFSRQAKAIFYCVTASMFIGVSEVRAEDNSDITLPNLVIKMLLNKRYEHPSLVGQGSYNVVKHVLSVANITVQASNAEPDGDIEGLPSDIVQERSLSRNCGPTERTIERKITLEVVQGFTATMEKVVQSNSTIAVTVNFSKLFGANLNYSNSQTSQQNVTMTTRQVQDFKKTEKIDTTEKRSVKAWEALEIVMRKEVKKNQRKFNAELTLDADVQVTSLQEFNNTAIQHNLKMSDIIREGKNRTMKLNGVAVAYNAENLETAYLTQELTASDEKNCPKPLKGSTRYRSPS